MLMIILTGLSGAGKTTLATALQATLARENYPSALIDGDVYRTSVHTDLGFGEADRREHIRRLYNIGYKVHQEGSIPIIAAINPYHDLRAQLGSDGCKLIYIHCALETLISRDTKGLYRKALLPDDHPHKLNDLSGINDRYDVPSNADLVIDTTNETVEQSVTRLAGYVLSLIAS